MQFAQLNNMDENNLVNLPYKLEREANIDEKKAQANEKYLQIQETMKYLADLNKEYVKILKEIEILIITPNF